MDTQIIIEYFGEFYNSSFFAVIRTLLSIYVIILLIDLVLVIILRGAGADIRTIMKGIDMPAGTKGKMTKRWLKIVQRLETGNASQYKVAILEADKFADEILGGIGYKGKNMAEKLEKADLGQIDNHEDLLKAHQVRNEIVYKKDFLVNKETAREVVGIYEDFLRSLEFIDS